MGLIQCSEKTSESSPATHHEYWLLHKTGVCHVKAEFIASKRALSQIADKTPTCPHQPPTPSSLFLYEWILENPSLYFYGFFLFFFNRAEAH